MEVLVVGDHGRRDQAQHAAESLAKGSRVVVMGRLQQRAWTAEDGSTRSAVEVVATELDRACARHGNDDQDDAEQGPVAGSTSVAGERDAGEGAARQRSAPTLLTFEL